MSEKNKKVAVAVAAGDGIGGEIMAATLQIFRAADVPIEYHSVEMGKAVFDAGYSTGMTESAREIIEKTGILFKGPMETPKGTGVKSINVTARKTWSTFANKRVFRSLAGVDTVFSRANMPINITVVRENIEDTYGGIEHMLTADVALCRRFTTRPGSLQLFRYAFEMARRKGAKRITCAHKANIMKITDGLFLECFREIASEYSDLKADDIIVDDLAMKLVTRPADFDVIVLPNFQGDIISDLCAGLVGGLGFAPSANIGDHISIFEAVHGTAPDIAGKNIANPTALILSGCMMLRHVGLGQYAAAIENALLYTLESGYRTADFSRGSEKPLSTTEFAGKIIANLGMRPAQGAAVSEVSDKSFSPPVKPPEHRMMVARNAGIGAIQGLDIFLESKEQPSRLAARIVQILPPSVHITTVSNRGTQVWPTGSLYTDLIDQYRVRLEASQGAQIDQRDYLKLSQQIAEIFKLCSVEFLMSYDGKRGYSLAQGQN